MLTDAATSKEQKAVRCYDLTSKIENGKLVWKAPKGEWRLIAAFVGKTFQKVKRAAPGGEGYVMNHFSAKAVSNYLNRFERAFAGKATDGSAGTPTEYPHNFFNDSYEVYGADWTDDLFEQFARRRGYKLEHFLPISFRKTGQRLPVALSPIIAKLLPNCFRRTSPASGRTGRTNMVHVPVTRHTVLPVI